MYKAEQELYFIKGRLRYKNIEGRFRAIVLG